MKNLKLYNSSTDGNFGTLTKNAVKSFQKSQKVSQDGSVGPDTLERLAKKGNVKYFKIKFNKNGGSGNLIYSDTLVVLNGVQTPIPSTKLSKSGSNHVGYTVTAKSLDGKTTYKYGCYTQNCSTGSRAYTEAQIKSSGKKFYPVVYNIGGTVAETGWLKGQVVTFTAMYCKSGETYDKTKSACVKSSSANTNTKYNISSGDYNMFVAVVCQEDGTGYTGALAVVDAIFNRVDKGYGKNPVAVIKAKGQFSAYGTGAYKKRIKNGAIISSCSGAKKAVDFRLANPTSRTHKFVNFKDKSLKNKYKNGVVYGDNVYHN